MTNQTPLVFLSLGVLNACDQVARMGGRAFEPSGQHAGSIGAAELLARLRRAVADLIVWLELKGRSDDAADVDDAVASVLEVARAYDRGELQAWLPDDERACPVEPLDQLVDAMRAAAGRLEELDDEIPAEVWEGYDDA